MIELGSKTTLNMIYANLASFFPPEYRYDRLNSHLKIQASVCEDSRLKILFVLGFPNPFPGAAWTRIGFFSDAWSQKGHSVEVLGAFNYKSLQKRGARKSGRVNIFNLIFKMGLNHPLIFASNSAVSFMVSTLFLIARKPNVVIVSVPSGEVGLGALIASKLVGVKCIVDYRDEWEARAIGLVNTRIGKSFYSAVKKLMASLHAKCHLVVAVTPNFMTSLKRRGVTNVRLIPNGADTKIFRPPSDRKGKQSFTIFYLGHIGGYYRVDVAVKAIKRFLDNGSRNIKLVIVGQGEVDRLLHLASELGISSNLEYRGEISDKAKLAELMAEADVGLVPYDNNPLWRNTLPTKFFEYCACGVPVVATVYEDSILAKLVNEHGVGLTVPPMDKDRLARTIEELYYNPEFVIAASKRARLMVEKSFDRAKIAKDLFNLVKQLVEM